MLRGEEAEGTERRRGDARKGRRKREKWKILAPMEANGSRG